MIGVDLAVPSCALAVGAHPDDIEFGCGATLAKWSAAGAEIHLLVCTDGSKGSWDDSIDTAHLVVTREAEQRAAAERLGATAVHHLRLVDGELTNGPFERARVCEVIRRVRPTVVLGHDPWKQYRVHPDHRNAGWLLLDAIVAARDPHFFPEQPVPPHRPEVALLFEAQEPDHVETVAGYVDVKIAALLEHRSQWKSTMGIGDDPVPQRARFEDRIRSTASAAGLRAGVRAAEAFRRFAAL